MKGLRRAWNAIPSLTQQVLCEPLQAHVGKCSLAGCVSLAFLFEMYYLWIDKTVSLKKIKEREEERCGEGRR